MVSSWYIFHTFVHKYKSFSCFIILRTVVSSYIQFCSVFSFPSVNMRSRQSAIWYWEVGRSRNRAQIHTFYYTAYFNNCPGVGYLVMLTVPSWTLPMMYKHGRKHVCVVLCQSWFQVPTGSFVIKCPTNMNTYTTVYTCGGLNDHVHAWPFKLGR